MQRKKFHECVLREILQERVVSSRGRQNPRGVKRKMSKFPIRHRHARDLPAINLGMAIRIVK